MKICLRTKLGHNYLEQGGTSVRAVGTQVAVWQAFEVEALPGFMPLGNHIYGGNVVVLQAEEGGCLRRENGGGGRLLADGDPINPETHFMLVKDDDSANEIVNGDIVSLRSPLPAFTLATPPAPRQPRPNLRIPAARDVGRSVIGAVLSIPYCWVTARDGGGGDVEITSGTRGEWERFELYFAPELRNVRFVPDELRVALGEHEECFLQFDLDRNAPPGGTQVDVWPERDAVQQYLSLPSSVTVNEGRSSRRIRVEVTGPKTPCQRASAVSPALIGAAAAGDSSGYIAGICLLPPRRLGFFYVDWSPSPCPLDLNTTTELHGTVHLSLADQNLTAKVTVDTFGARLVARVDPQEGNVTRSQPFGFTIHLDSSRAGKKGCLPIRVSVDVPGKGVDMEEYAFTTTK